MDNTNNDKLPIYRVKDQIVRIVKENQVTIISGPTGCGKTTTIPYFLLEADMLRGGMVGITQPRRLAAIAAAEYLAKKHGLYMGKEVGYKIRFDNQTEDATLIKVMTEGILLREMQRDRYLAQYSHIIADEFHERSQNIDFIIGLLKDLLRVRTDLKLILSSANLDEQKISKYFKDAPIIRIKSRNFPIVVKWAERDYHKGEILGKVVEKIADAYQNGGQGDILAFVPGSEDINYVLRELSRRNLRSAVLLPAHGGLDPNQQKLILETYPGKRKIVVATNIAETSVTLDGTVHLVDSGYIKVARFYPQSGIQSLETVQHSQAGCVQREGRVGRTQPGICYRLYTEKNFRSRPKFSTPEILCKSLSSVVLTMEAMGIRHIQTFDFIDKPEPDFFHEAYETLIALGAIERRTKKLTPLGITMAKFPLDPEISRMLLEAQKYGCVEEIATVASFMSIKNVFSRPKDKEMAADRAHAKFQNPKSDALTALRIWDEYIALGCSERWCVDNYLNPVVLQEIGKIRDEIIAILTECGIEITSYPENHENIMKTVASGLMYNLFVPQDTREFTFSGVLRNIYDVFIHPSSSVHNQRMKCFVASDIMQTSKNFARTVTQVMPHWLPEMVPHLCTFGKTELKKKQPDGSFLANRDILLNGRYIGRQQFPVTMDDAKCLT